MDLVQHNAIVSFIWGIADDVLEAVLAMKARLDAAGIANQDAALRPVAGQAFYNTSAFMLRNLQSRDRAQQLRTDFEAYLTGFSPNVREILEEFRFRNQIPTLVEADALGFLIGGENEAGGADDDLAELAVTDA